MTRMRAPDWSQVQNMMEGMEGAIGVHPLSMKEVQYRKAIQGGRHIPMCPIFSDIPSVPYIANVTGIDVCFATCIPNTM